VPVIDAAPLPDEAEAADPLAFFDQSDVGTDAALALNNW
jgi:hypothetical protein